MPRLPRLIVVAVAAFAIAACGSSGSPASSAGGPPASGGTASGCQPTSQSGGAAVSIVNFAFNPATIQAKVGQPITWTNNDSIGHGAVLDNDSACSTGTLAHGSSNGLVFSAPGTYTYHCTVHGKSMTGTIQVSS